MISKLRLGNVEVARMGLGTNRLSKTPGNIALVREALATGIGLVDTAHGYAGGESEETIGAALASAADECVVATKGGNGRPGRGKAEILHGEIEESLRRLRTNEIVLYYLHRVDSETPLEESLAVLKDHRDRGSIRHVGICEVSIEEIEQARRVVPIAAVQNHYNVFERKHDAVVDYCATEGIAFVAFFPLQGTGAFPLQGERGSALETVSARRGATRAQIALAWLLRRSPAILPIPGTQSREHLRENMGALRIELTDAEFDALA